MNKKAINEFGFRRMSRIMQISEDDIHRDRRAKAEVDNTLLDLHNSSYPTQTYSLIAKYRVKEEDWLIPT